jgi:hypothetical protein
LQQRTFEKEGCAPGEFLVSGQEESVMSVFAGVRSSGLTAVFVFIMLKTEVFILAVFWCFM